jgi:lysophospholipase L1-like esterase
VYQDITLEQNTYYQLRFRAKGDLNRFCQFGVKEADSGLIRYMPEIYDTSAIHRNYKLNFKTATDTNWRVEFRVTGIADNSTEVRTFKDVVIQKINSLATAEYAIGALGDSQLIWIGTSSAELDDNSLSFTSTAIAKVYGDLRHYVIPVIDGEGGNNAGQVLARVGNITGHSPKPTFCMIETGTNDAAGGTAMPTFRANVISIINALETASVTPILMNVPPRTDEPANSAVEAYSDEIEDIAVVEGVALLDARGVFLANPDWATEYMIDQVHFNTRAHQAIGRVYGDLLLGMV